MKNQVTKLALVATTALLMNVGWVLADETSAPSSSPNNPSGVPNAAPGTAAGMTSKDGQNNPPGTDTQKVASTPSGTKKHHKKPKGTMPVANQSPDAATKSPQVITPVNVQ
jgi:hypothetical protein